MPRTYEPCERDLDIYYAVKAAGQLQCEVAKRHRLTQSRVSKIVTRVRQWIAEQRPGGAFTVPQEMLLAADIHVEKLKVYERQAAAAFKQTCTTPGKSGFTRPDPRLIKAAIECSTAVMEAACSLASIQGRCQQNLAAPVKPVTPPPPQQVSYEMPAMTQEAPAETTTRNAANTGATNTSAQASEPVSAPKITRANRNIPPVATDGEPCELSPARAFFLAQLLQNSQRVPEPNVPGGR